jgi:hypothetical protein
MNINELKALAAESRPDLPTAEVVDYLVKNYKGKGTLYPPPEVTKRVCPNQLAAVLETLTMLSSEEFGVLKKQWIFFDHDQEEMYELTSGEVADAFKYKEFFHPNSGRQVYDFSQYIAVTFQSTNSMIFLSEKAAAQV